MTRHRANLCAQLGDGTAHAGNTISVVNAFSAVFNVNLTLLAQTFSTRGIDFQAVVGAPLSEWSQAGLVLGIAMSFVFTANTTMSCLETSKSFMRFCKETEDVEKQKALPFPSSHYKALKILSSYGTITSMRMVFNPLINTLACPMLAGFFLGTRGLLFLLSGSNVLILCFSTFLMNAGQSWFSAR
ncbi:hppA, partial [Symbiodinium sp. KB8]